MLTSSTRLLAQEKSGYARIEPPCPYFGTCGGCSLQDLAYHDQLALKQERVQQAFAEFDEVPPINIVGIDDPWRYRNKAEFTFSTFNGHVVLGYHVGRSFWKVVNLDDCLIVPGPVERIVRTMRSLAEHTGLPAYEMKTHKGFFRYLLIRMSHATGRILLCLMTSSGSREVVEHLAQEIIAQHPSILSFYWGVTNRIADIAVPEELALIKGSRYLEEQVGPFRLQLHPLSFLQPMSVQADRMYTRLCEFLGHSNAHTAWDLYCGIGVIALYLARHFGTVYGIDMVEHHRELAILNASLNGINHIDFRTGCVEKLLSNRRFWIRDAKPDAVVVDPPRAGLHPQAIASILAARPQRLAYLSCNLKSLLCDLRFLLSSFPRYRFCAVEAFDMFPQTPHVETLVLLERKR